MQMQIVILLEKPLHVKLVIIIMLVLAQHVELMLQHVHQEVKQLHVIQDLEVQQIVQSLVLKED